MASVLEIRDRLAKLTGATLRKEVANLILSSDEIKQAKIEDFVSGVRPDGNIIGVYKNEAYKRKKTLLSGSAGSRVDLILNGKFVTDLFVENIRPSEFIFKSPYDKSDLLFKTYGDDLRKINQKDFEDVWNLHLAGKYREALRKITGL